MTLRARRFLSLLFILPAFLFCRQSQYRITDHGAVGDGTTLNTASIQRAIDSCSAHGGGTVIVPPGVFVTGTIRLKSYVDLHLENGAVLRGSPNLQDYYLDGKRVGLIFTQNAERVSITGVGTIDGNGDVFMDLTHAKKIDSAGSAWTRQKGNFRNVREGLGDGPLVPKERPFQMIIFSNCRGVTLRDMFVKDSPFWTIHCADCDGVVVSGLRIWCNMLVPNNDGIDFTSCSNVQVSDCDIRTGDDCIVLTGYDHHFDLPGYNRISHPSENITVTNCTLQSRSAAIRIGGFDQNPMRNYIFSNITITNSNRGIGIFARDQGSIENLIFSNIFIDTRLQTGDWWGQGDPIHLSAVRLLNDVAPGTIKHVTFDNVICRGESGIAVYGTEESVIEDVTFDNVSIEIRESPLNEVAGGNFDLRPVLDPKLQIFSHDIPGFYVRWAKDVSLRSIRVQWGAMKEPYFSNAVEAEYTDGLKIEDFRGEQSPSAAGAFPIVVRNAKRFWTDANAKLVRKEKAAQ